MPDTGFDRVMRAFAEAWRRTSTINGRRAADGLTGIADMMAQLGDEFRGPALELLEDARARSCG